LTSLLYVCDDRYKQQWSDLKHFIVLMTEPVPISSRWLDWKIILCH
jgi:hypothetical protein